MSTNQATAPETKQDKPQKESKIFQLVLALIIFVGFAVLLFVPDLLTDGQSLFNGFLDLFKDPDLYPTGYKAVYLGFLGVYAVMLVLTVLSFFANKKAVFAFNCVKLFAALAAVGYCAYYFASLGGTVSLAGILTDDKTYVALNALTFMLFFGLVMLFVVCISYYKGLGVVKAISALFALGFAVFLFYEAAFLGDAHLADLFDLNYSFREGGTWETVLSYTFIILAYASAANLLFALLSLAIRHMAVADLIRSAVMFVASVVAFILLFLEVKFDHVFEYAGTVSFLAISLVQIVYSVIVFVLLASSKNKKKEAVAEQSKYETDPNSQQMAIRGFGRSNADQPAYAQVDAAAETAFSADAARANAAFDDAAQISIEDIVAQNAAAENETGYGDAIRDTSAKPAEEVTEEIDFEQKQHDGQFNRTYTDYRAAEEARNAQQSTPQQPYAYGAGYAQQYAQVAPGYYGGPVPYLPDAFINSLTPAERDEFDKLFISRIYGDNKRLPAYKVGSDNREFFAKVFVFMGRYRTIISEGLLEKIYNYSNSIR